MKAPNELYLHPNHKGEVGGNWLTFALTNQDIKYIRADLAELTWKDIKEIDELTSVCFTDCEHGDSSKEIYQEVLRRFNESRNIH